MNHDDVGHCGFGKTLQRIRKNYWFAKMRKFVKKYVSSCLECSHHKAPGGKREGELHPIDKPSVPFHTVHGDHLGPFIKSKKKILNPQPQLGFLKSTLAILGPRCA